MLSRKVMAISVSVVAAIIILVVLLVTLVDFNSIEEDIIVTTDDGLIRGSVLKSRLGSNFYGFRGVRYGRPPTGDLRYKAPLPVEPWTGVLDGSNDGPMCPQPGQPPSAYSEDCLRLNVYTKNISTDRLVPVVVYIHGGSLYMGSGVRTHYGGPEYLMDRDIVVVTLNYRLGTLGFLAINTTEAPGNAGYKDQVLALKWVQRNIKKFGGDPDSVTLFGNSAGSTSIVHHMVSPMTEGLFHRVILASSAVSPKKPFSSHSIDIAVSQANLLGCPATTIDEIWSCLRDVDLESIVKKTLDMLEMGLVPKWRAVIEPDFGQERFLTEDSYLKLKSGRFTNVPALIGITLNEFGSAAVGITSNQNLLTTLDENFSFLAPKLLEYEPQTGSDSQFISDQLWSDYGLSHPLSVSHIKNLEYLVSDAHIGFPVHRFADIVGNKSDVYFYRFSYQGVYSHFYLPDGKPYGVEHCDDLLYVLVRPIYAPMIKAGERDEFQIDRMTKIWENFAWNGNPNPSDGDQTFNRVKWIRYTEEDRDIMDIDKEFSMHSNLFGNRFQFWDNLFPR